jgi:hypothetical protein
MAQVKCNDGTIEEAIVGESDVANCSTHGGINTTRINTVEQLPEPTEQELKEQSDYDLAQKRENTKRKIKYYTQLGVPLLGLTSTFMIPNALPHEKAYARWSIIGGIILQYIGSDPWSGNTNKTTDLIGKSLVVGGASYSLARALKQTPKNSLIMASLLVLGNIALNYEKPKPQTTPLKSTPRR